MKELMEILASIRPDVDFENETRLIDDGILESFDIMVLIGEINDTFNVNIDVGDLDPANFNNIQSIWALIESLR